MHTPDSLPQQQYPPSGFLVFRHVFAKRGRMILIVTGLAFAAALCAGLLIPKSYQAKALLLPAQEEKGMMNAMLSQMGGLAILAGGAMGGGTSADLYMGMLRSETVKDPIIERFKLREVYGMKTRTDTYAALDREVSISAGKKDGIIAIAVEDHDPQRAADLANAFVEELQKLTVTLNISGAGKNRTFLEERLAQSKGDLAKAEVALSYFQAKNKAVNLPEQAKATIEGVARLKAELAVQEVQLASLRRTLTDSTKEVKDLKTTVANLRDQVSRREGAGGGSSAIPSVGAMPALGEQYLRLMREFKTQENLVELLTKQYEMARFTEAKDTAPFQVLQKAKVPDKKIKPRIGFIVVMGTLTSFLFALALAFVLEGFGGSRGDGQESGEALSAAGSTRNLSGP